ncbi:glycosyltransferase family 2 protein [Kineococcus sp. SYSU DK001]|uniref:glycosyltransferase family 2 protein n=1 Tax=Kineococcus sp. SYSU DK001 TaxID=3383122 RepID=UPI003D7DC2A9
MSGLGVVVVNYGDPAVLEENLLRHDLAPVSSVVVVVDNFSGERNREAAERLCAGRGLEFCPLPTNAGFGPGVNAGAARALELGCDAVLVVNPDLRVPPEVVAALHAEVVADPRRVVAPRIVREDGRHWFDGAEVSLRTGRTRRTGRLPGPDLRPWLTGACLAVHRDLWTELGGFADGYFLYWEDVDLSLRALGLGANLHVRADLEAVHLVGATQQQGFKSATYVEFNCRNRLLFARRHLPPRRVARFVASSPVYAAEVLRRDGWRRLLRDRSPVRAAVRGTVAGWRIALSPRRRPVAGPARPGPAPR